MVRWVSGTAINQRTREVSQVMGRLISLAFNESIELFVSEFTDQTLDGLGRDIGLIRFGVEGDEDDPVRGNVQVDEPVSRPLASFLVAVLESGLVDGISDTGYQVSFQDPSSFKVTSRALTKI